MESLNLDIDIYTKDELLSIFHLKKNYTYQDVDASKKKLSEQLKKINSLGNEKKREIQFFIDTASSKLINKDTLLNQSLNQPLNQSHQQNKDFTYTQSKNDVIFSGTHAIIENSNELVGRSALRAGGRSAGSADMQPGYLNPINVRTVTQGVNIDTRFRDKYYSTSSSNFVLHLPEIQKRVVTLRIATIEIPMTHYAISRQRGNSTFVIQGEIDPSDQVVVLQTNLNSSEESRTATLPGGGRKAWLVVLPDGNYELDWQGQSNATSIVVAMNNAIALAKPGYMSIDGTFGAYPSPAQSDYLNPSQDIAFNVDRVSGRAIFARPSTSTPSVLLSLFGDGAVRINFAVDYGGNLSLDENLQLRLGWELGFRMGHYEGINTDGFSIVSEGICMITGPRYAYISLNDGQKSTGSSFIAAYAKSSLDKNIITRINIAAVADDVGIYKTSSDAGLSNQLNRTREYFGPVDIERLEIKLFDEYGRILELNNMDWSMTLVFEKLYD
jgi:hypothetical protein